MGEVPQHETELTSVLRESVIFELRSGGSVTHREPVSGGGTTT